MPFKSSKYIFTILFTIYFIIGKNGKTLHLLKQTAKKSGKRKKREVVPLLGTLQAYHAAKEQASAQHAEESELDQSAFEN